MTTEDKIRKKGYLKHDLYNFNTDHYQGMVFRKPWGSFWLLTKEQQDKLIEEFKSRFSLVLKEGAEFVCYIVDGKEEWYDNENYGVEGVDETWAAEYLRGITKV